jgi:hypothetical protein
MTEPVNNDYVPKKKIDNISKIIGTGPDTIKVIKNFMPQKDIESFIKFGNEFLHTKKEKTHHWVVAAEHIVNKPIAYLFKKYENLMRSEAEKQYSLAINKDRGLDFFIHPVNSYLEPHTDIIDYHQEEVYDVGNLLIEQEKVWPFLWSGHVSIIIYLNDNYEGGVLYFPDQNVEIKPEPGMLVIFPGNLHFLHGVTPTLNNPRYTVSLWTRFTDFKNEIMDEES